WPRGLEWLFVAALGALHSLPFVATSVWPLQLLVIALFAWRVDAASPRRAAGLGWLFGSAWLAAGTWWLFISMHRYGGLPAWLAALAVALLSGLLSLYLAAAMAGFARWRCGAALRDGVLFAALWLLAELARGVIFTGFPWVASGYAQVDSPLAVFAPWIGVYGLGALTAWLAAWLAFAARAGRYPLALAGVSAAVLTIAAALTGPGRYTQDHGRLSVTLLQGNVAQDEKFAVEHMPEALAWTSAQLLEARGELVVGPETVIPLLPDQVDADYWNRLLHHFRDGPQAALIGLPLGDPQQGYTNSAAGISAATAALPDGYYRYDKHHLVPFGEFIPTGFRWFTEMMNIPLGDFNRGPLAPAPFAVGAQRIAANICYEDLFGEELAARFADAASAPTVFANLSNIGWFGDTIAVAQHLQISRMRALEFQLPMLRATNTGATVVIDAAGRVTASLAPFTQGVLNAEVQGRSGLTPFAWWASRFGLWPLWAAGALAVALLARLRARSAA
ncbi:MAG TPA: apolipoprotein N-acyltransferase, partial [Burkholderiaceae bacterium]|nr:apolipoprotein N-acyltransferase [Burkholderiaceae bacterium]